MTGKETQESPWPEPTGGRGGEAKYALEATPPASRRSARTFLSVRSPLMLPASSLAGLAQSVSVMSPEIVRTDITRSPPAISMSPLTPPALRSPLIPVTRTSPVIVSIETRVPAGAVTLYATETA